MCRVRFWLTLPSIALDTPSSRSPTLCHLPILKSPGELVVQRPFILWHLYRNHTRLKRADGTTWRQTRYNYSPWEAHLPGSERRGGSCGPAQRGDFNRARHFSPSLSPPSWGLPVLDVASPPSTLTLRACLRVAEVAARAGRSCVLLLLVLLWPPSLSGRLGSRS